MTDDLVAHVRAILDAGGIIMTLDSQPGRWKRIEHDVCKGCRSGSRALPGRAFR